MADQEKEPHLSMESDSAEDSAEMTGETGALLALHCSWSTSAYETESANKTSSGT